MDKKERSKRSRQLGVNKYARADIGQSYVINSAKLEGEEGFAYHAAAVVANSEDGKDHLTLENYNRASSRTALIKELRVHLEEMNKKKAKRAMKAFNGPNQSRGNEDAFIAS